MSRGRDAEHPTEITAAGWKDIVFRLKDKIATDRVGLISAGVAFYGLLALFPAITAIIAISGLLVEPSQVVDQISNLSGIMPEEVITIITDQASAVAGSSEGGLGLAALLGIVIAIYSASKGMGSLMQGINVAYDEEETRGFIKLKLVTLALTVVLIIGIIVAMSATLAIPTVLTFADFGPTFETLLTVAIWISLFFLTILGLSVLYRFAPSRDEPEWQWASIGAISGCFLWLSASAGFAIYVSNFSTYNESFGTLAGVIVLLMWLWISAFVILLGAELNAEVEAQTRYDTTTGPDSPMGERDAQKADNLGAAEGK